MIMRGMFKPKGLSFYKWLLHPGAGSGGTAYVSNDPTSFVTTTTPTFLTKGAFGYAECNRSVIVLGADLSGDNSGYITGPKLANIGITELTQIPTTTTYLYGGRLEDEAYFAASTDTSIYVTSTGGAWTGYTLAALGIQPFGVSTNISTFGRMRSGRWVLWVTNGVNSVNYYSDDVGHPVNWTAPGLTPDLGRGDPLQHDAGRTWFLNANANSNVYTTDGVSWISTGLNSVPTMPAGNMKQNQFATDGLGTWLSIVDYSNNIYIHKSVDLGLTWTQVHSKASVGGSPHITFADGKFVATDHNVIEVTEDNGSSWTTATGPTGRWVAVPLYA